MKFQNEQATLNNEIDKQKAIIQKLDQEISENSNKAKNQSNVKKQLEQRLEDLEFSAGKYKRNYDKVKTQRNELEQNIIHMR